MRDDWWLGMMGRLKPGTNVEQVGAHMKVLSQPLFGAVVPQDWPSKSQDIFRKYTFAVLPAATGAGGPFALRAHYRQPLEILMFVVGLVLLIACANIASLPACAIRRAPKRNRSPPVFGASRGRLIRQVLTESVVLSGAGAHPRCFLRALGECAVSSFRFHAGEPSIFGCPDGRPRLSFHNRHRRIMRPTFRHSPCVALTRVSAMSAMKEGQSQGAGGRSQSVAARWIVAVQVAFSLILLIGTGLFIRTFTNLVTLDAGFDRNNVLMVETNIHNAQIPEPARASLYGQMLAKLEAVPGVVSASQCRMTPLSGRNGTLFGDCRWFASSGADSDIFLNWITPDFFATMRTPILEGRVFDARDTANFHARCHHQSIVGPHILSGQNPVGNIPAGQ